MPLALVAMLAAVIQGSFMREPSEPRMKSRSGLLVIMEERWDPISNRLCNSYDVVDCDVHDLI